MIPDGLHHLPGPVLLLSETDREAPPELIIVTSLIDRFHSLRAWYTEARRQPELGAFHSTGGWEYEICQRRRQGHVVVAYDIKLQGLDRLVDMVGVGERQDGVVRERNRRCYRIWTASQDGDEDRSRMRHTDHIGEGQVHVLVRESFVCGRHPPPTTSAPNQGSRRGDSDRHRAAWHDGDRVLA